MFMINTPISFWVKLEDVIANRLYLRYEKGNFKRLCLLKEQKIVIVNKILYMEGKINALLDILKTVPLDTTQIF